MIERLVIRGNRRTEVDAAIEASTYTLAKVFPTWDTHADAKAGWLVYDFTVLYPAERAALQAIEGALYFSRQSDLEAWFNGD